VAAAAAVAGLFGAFGGTFDGGACFLQLDMHALRISLGCHHPE
jgi:hypothetical protein